MKTLFVFCAVCAAVCFFFAVLAAVAELWARSEKRGRQKFIKKGRT